MRTVLASVAALLLAAHSAPALSQTVGSETHSTTTTTTTSTVKGPPMGKAEARRHFRDAGYTHVRALLQGPDGVWHAKARKDGQAHDVSFDLSGNIVAN